MAKGKNYSNNYFNNKHSNGSWGNLTKNSQKPLYVMETNKCYSYAKGQPEGPRFDMTDNGAILRVYLKNPSVYEQGQFKSDHPLSIKTMEVKDSLFMLFKFGDLPWFDAPYNVHLSPLWKNIPTSGAENQGFALTIEVYDTNDGKLLSGRLYKMPHDVSVQLLEAVKHQQKMDFDTVQYDRNLQETLMKYTTDQLVELASTSTTSDTEECITIPHFNLDNGTVSQVAKDCEIVISMLRDKNTTPNDCTFTFSGFCFEIRNHDLYLNNQKVTGKYFDGVLEGLTTQYNQSSLFASLGLDITTMNPNILGL